MAAASVEESVCAEGFVLRNHATFGAVQDHCDFPSAYALLCCSRLAAELLQDVGLYELSARRASLIVSIPPYVAFGLRTDQEVRDIALHPERVRAPEVPAEITELAAMAGALEDGGGAAAPSNGGCGQLRAARSRLKAMEQAKLTYLFSAGLQAYESKKLILSDELLEKALAMAPDDDVLLSRLADTRFARYQAARSAVLDAEELKASTVELYRKAIRVNPCSSFGFNGLSLFQESDDMKRKYLLQAVALDDKNSYALTNLGMCLLDEPDVCGKTARLCLSLLKRAVAINPNLFYARPTIATLHLQLRQYHEAVAILAEHVARRPEDESSSRLHDYLVDALAGRDHGT